MGSANYLGERRKDSGRCLASYSLLHPVDESILPESYWWRAHAKRLRLYTKDVEFGEKTMRDLKRVPAGARKVSARSSHKTFLSHYEIVFIDEDGNTIEVPHGAQ